MQFNSIDFMMFFPVVTTVYFLVPRKGRLPWLLAASYYFYMRWNPKYALLILFSTVATWLCGLALEWKKRGAYRQTVLALCLLANLAILGFFKYANFALETLDALAHVTGFSGGDVQRRFSLLLPASGQNGHVDQRDVFQPEAVGRVYDGIQRQQHRCSGMSRQNVEQRRGRQQHRRQEPHVFHTYSPGGDGPLPLDRVEPVPLRVPDIIDNINYRGHRAERNEAGQDCRQSVWLKQQSAASRRCEHQEVFDVVVDSHQP